MPFALFLIKLWRRCRRSVVPWRRISIVIIAWNAKILWVGELLQLLWLGLTLLGPLPMASTLEALIIPVFSWLREWGQWSSNCSSKQHFNSVTESRVRFLYPEQVHCPSCNIPRDVQDANTPLKSPRARATLAHAFIHGQPPLLMSGSWDLIISVSCKENEVYVIEVGCPAVVAVTSGMVTLMVLTASI